MSKKDFLTIPGLSRTDTRAAFHEAGHAVAAIVLGVQFRRVEIGAQAEDRGDTIMFRRGLMSWDEGQSALAFNLDRAITAMGGPESVDKLIGGPDINSDREEANDILYITSRLERAIPSVSPSDVQTAIVFLRACARAVIDENWAGVTAIAHSLAEKGKLTHDEVKAIFFSAITKA